MCRSPSGAATPASVSAVGRSAHHLVLVGQFLYLEPPLVAARVNWLGQLQSCLSVVCDIPLIRSTRYDMLAEVTSTLSQCADMRSHSPAFYFFSLSLSSSTCPHTTRECTRAMFIRLSMCVVCPAHVHSFIYMRCVSCSLRRKRIVLC